MPRNPDGTYQLPPGTTPVTPNTVIASANENTVRTDLATEMGYTLDVRGYGGMQAPFRIADGTAAAPGLAFISDTNTGLYLIAQDILGVAVGGLTPMSLAATAVAISQQFAFNTGGLRVPPSNIQVTAGNDNQSSYPSIGYNWTGTGLSGQYTYAGNDQAFAIKFDGATSPSPGFRFFSAPSGLFSNPITFGEQLRVAHVSNAVNFLTIRGGAIGSGVSILTGDSGEANVNLSIAGKGDGTIRFISRAGSAEAGTVVQINPLGAGILAVNRIELNGGGSGVSPVMQMVGTDGNISFVIAAKGNGHIRFFTGANDQVKVVFSPGPNHLILSGGADPLITTSGGSLTITGSAAGSAVSVFKSFDTSDTALSIWQRVDGAISAQLTMLAIGEMQFGTSSAHPLTFIVGSVERLRLTSTTLSTPGTISVTSNINMTYGVPHVMLNGAGYTGRHWLDGTAYFLGQDSAGRSLKLFSGGDFNIGVVLTAGATAWAALSDERQKDIYGPIENAAAKVASMRHVIGAYKHDELKRKRAMLIAQDVLKVLPEAISIDNEGTLMLEYTSIIPLHGAAISEHETRIRSLEGKLNA